MLATVVKKVFFWRKESKKVENVFCILCVCCLGQKADPSFATSPAIRGLTEPNVANFVDNEPVCFLQNVMQILEPQLVLVLEHVLGCNPC